MKWEMRNGEKIDIKEMSNNHLINTIKMIERKADNGIFIGGGYTWDTNSLYGDYVYGKEALEQFEEYQFLIKEAKKRNLF